MNRFRRELAPITAPAWAEIESQARRWLQNAMTLRLVVDVSGPHGPDLGAVSVGRLKVPSGQMSSGPQIGVHQVQPIIEVRVPFKLDIWELDNIERGATDLKLTALEEACRTLVKFEEESVYGGLKAAGLEGLTSVASQKSISFGGDLSRFLDAVAQAETNLNHSLVDGPYALVVPEPVWQHLSSVVDGRPLKRHVEYLIDGPVIPSAFVPQSMLISTRGGDLELVLAEDVSIGFQSVSADKVELYLSESFTFRVHDPDVVVFLS